MTPLAQQLVDRIKRAGPLTIAEYMTECLLHPSLGYYTTSSPFGRGGDFTTAPEISQMFGELVGLCLAQSWLDRGCPDPFCLAELGPGRGTLMADLWRATKGVPGFHDAARVTLVEASPALRQTQAEALASASPNWVNQVSDLPQMPLFLVANEFFDALPIRQFLRTETGWDELHVGLSDEQFAMGRAPADTLAPVRDRLDDTKPGQVVERCTAAEAIIQELATHISELGGVALVFDYGDWRSFGDTLQAVQRHNPVPVLSAPGQSDLTAHVDFEALSNAAATCSVSQMIPQGVFLERLGIGHRAQTLAAALQGPARDSHLAAYRRLTHASEMGTLFKTLGLSQKGSPQVPGLQPWP